MGDVIRDTSGRRLRSTEECLEAWKRNGHPAVKIKLYNKSTHRVIEGWKNLVDNRRIYTVMRKPTFEEELKYDTILFQRGKSPVTGKFRDQMEVEIDAHGNENVAVKTANSILKK